MITITIVASLLLGCIDSLLPALIYLINNSPQSATLPSVFNTLRKRKEKKGIIFKTDRLRDSEWGGGGRGLQNPTHFLKSILRAPVPPPLPPPTPTHTRSQIQFWPQCYASGREVSINLILVGTIITFQRHRMEHQPFADSQLRQSFHPSVSDQTLFSWLRI